MGRALETLRRSRVLPVVVLDSADDALPLAEVLVRAGVDCVEITLRTPAGLPAMALLKGFDGLTVGAGTVTTVSEVEACAEAGASFIVSPGFDEDVVRAGIAAGLDVFPGVASPSEVMAALKAGATVLKCFPAAQLGGPAWIAAMRGPFPGVEFVPSGGVGLENAAEYLEAGVAALGTSWIAPRKLVAEHQFEEIERRAREFRAAIDH